MTKSELEKRIFLHFSKIPFSTFEDMRKIFKCTKNDLTEIIEKNTKTDLGPLGFILVDRKKSPYRYSIEPTNYDTIHIQINNYLKGIDSVLKLFYKSLSNKSNLFENDSEDTISLSKKGRITLDSISMILDRIQQLSFLITHYKSINQIPKNRIEQSDEDHQKCLNMYSNIIKNLQNLKNEGKLHQQSIELHLFKHQFVENHLTPSI